MKRQLAVLLTLSALLVGLGLRLSSLRWNDRLQGDVNLFALTAREFVTHDRLAYPMKYEYSDHVEYRTLHSPASQHPILWPLLAGVAGKTFSSDATFAILKALSFVVGVGLLFVVAVAGRRKSRQVDTPVAVLLMATAPMLVDFSANGSSYIGSALLLLLALLLLDVFEREAIRHYVAAGLLCGVGIQLHSALVLVPVAFVTFWVLARIRPRPLGVAAFALSGLIAAAPWMLWNLRHFGQPLYSYSTLFLLKELELARVATVDGTITTQIVGTIDGALLLRYGRMVAENVFRFVGEYAWELGPGCVILMMVGAKELYRTRRRHLLAALSVGAMYALTVFLWGTFRYRFLVPVLPLAYVVAAFGADAWHARGSWPRLIAWACVLAAVGWHVLAFFEDPPTRYYRRDASHRAMYEQMRPLANRLRTAVPGVVLGYAESLDGGIETVYWHRLPFVTGRGLSEEQLEKLVRDFGVRYIWSDQQTAGTIRANFPEASVRFGNERYTVFELLMDGPVRRRRGAGDADVAGPFSSHGRRGDPFRWAVAGEW